MNRREALQSLAALAAGRVAAGDTPIPADDVDKLAGGEYLSGRVEPGYLEVNGYGNVGEFAFGGYDPDDRSVEVWYDPGRVMLSKDVKGSNAYGGSYAVLDREQARELAVALYLAAEESEDERQP